MSFFLKGLCRVVDISSLDPVKNNLIAASFSHYKIALKISEKIIYLS